jgi:DNA-directed RNA polymerase specialized sigma subunit
LGVVRGSRIGGGHQGGNDASDDHQGHDGGAQIQKTTHGSYSGELTTYCTETRLAIAQGRRARTVFRVETYTTTNKRAISLALIDETEGRGEQNKKLRLAYIEIEQQITAAARNNDEAEVAKLSSQLSRIGDTFVRYNMGLAGVLVKKYAGQTKSKSDVESYMLACLEAFWSAFTTWDPEKSTFGTWSRLAIQGALWREIHFHERPHRRYHEELMFRASVNHAEGLREVLGREPTDVEIATAAGITVAQLREVRRQANLSLDKPGPDGESTLADIIAGDDEDGGWGDAPSDGLALLNTLSETSSEDDMWLRALAAATNELDDLSLYLVFVRTGLHGWTPENLPEIAAVTGKGREIVRRKIHKALETVTAAGKNLPSQLR